MNNRY